MIKGKEADVFDSTKHHLESMLSKIGDKSATDLFETFFNGVIAPEFLKTYGVELRYTKNYSKLINKLDECHKSLIFKGIS